MDPVTMVVAALAAGAAAGLSDTSKQVVADAYQGLKRLINGKYNSVDLEIVEAQPGSNSRQAVLFEELENAGAGNDEELIEAAQHLLRIMRAEVPEAIEAVGVKLRGVRAGGVEIYDVTATGNAVAVDGENLLVDGPLRISGIRAGMQEPPHPPVARR
ncbi:hypothetical protein ABZ413_27615 [Nocardia rhamnosiphila]|uniref:hypothetical protein n=1 Tax=Nocardia rhamnosiphila TaxID=426716 RepID=UPI0033C8E132